MDTFFSAPEPEPEEQINIDEEYPHPPKFPFSTILNAQIR